MAGCTGELPSPLGPVAKEGSKSWNTGEKVAEVVDLQQGQGLWPRDAAHFQESQENKYPALILLPPKLLSPVPPVGGRRPEVSGPGRLSTCLHVSASEGCEQSRGGYSGLRGGGSLSSTLVRYRMGRAGWGAKNRWRWSSRALNIQCTCVLSPGRGWRGMGLLVVGWITMGGL